MCLFHRINLLSYHLHFVDLLRNCLKNNNLVIVLIICVERKRLPRFLYVLECSYSPLARAWLSNSARMPSRSSLRRVFPGAGPRPRWGFMYDIVSISTEVLIRDLYFLFQRQQCSASAVFCMPEAPIVVGGCAKWGLWLNLIGTRSRARTRNGAELQKIATVCWPKVCYTACIW